MCAEILIVFFIVCAESLIVFFIYKTFLNFRKNKLYCLFVKVNARFLLLIYNKNALLFIVSQERSPRKRYFFGSTRCKKELTRSMDHFLKGHYSCGKPFFVSAQSCTNSAAYMYVYIYANIAYIFHCYYIIIIYKHASMNFFAFYNFYPNYYLLLFFFILFDMFLTNAIILHKQKCLWLLYCCTCSTYATTL